MQTGFLSVHLHTFWEQLLLFKHLKSLLFEYERWFYPTGLDFTLHLFLLYFACHQVMFLQNKGHVTMTIELLDTEEAQADDPLDVQVNTALNLCRWCAVKDLIEVAPDSFTSVSSSSVPVELHGAVCRNRVQSVLTSRGLLLQTCISAQVLTSHIYTFLF